MCAATFVADPPGDADRQAGIEAVPQLALVTGEAMRDAGAQPRQVVAQDRHEIRVRIALMQKDRPAGARGELELPAKCPLLRIVRCEVAEIIQAALAGSADIGVAQQGFELRQLLFAKIGRVVGMNAGCGTQDTGMSPRQLDRAARAVETGTCNDHLCHTRGAGAREDGIAVGIVTVVREVDADVDKHARALRCSTHAAIACYLCALSKPDTPPTMPLDPQSLDDLRIPRDADTAQRRYGGGAGTSPRVLWIAGGALVVVAALVAAIFLRGASATEVRTANAQAVQGSSQSAVLNASGFVVARRLATVSSKVTGKIQEVLIEEGTAVKEGQVLARLDDTTVRAQYQFAQKQLDAARSALAEVQVRLDEARRNLKRTQALRERNLVSETALDAAQSEAKALEARLAALEGEVGVAVSGLRLRERDLDDLVIRAPFDGVVISKDAQPGEMVSPVSAGGGFTRTGVATIVDMNSREIEVDVNEAFINRVRAGQRTEAVLDAYADLVLASRVINIVPTADRQKATVRVRIAFDELDPRILPDMGVKVRFLDTEQQAAAAEAPRVLALVPSSAISSADGKTYVWVVNEDVVERRAVSTGRERDGQTEVTAGVRAGEVVVAPAVEGLKDGGKVRINAS